MKIIELPKELDMSLDDDILKLVTKVILMGKARKESIIKLDQIDIRSDANIDDEIARLLKEERQEDSDIKVL